MKKNYQCFYQRIKRKCPYEALMALQASTIQLKAELCYIRQAQASLEQALQSSWSLLKKTCEQPYLDGYTWQSEQIAEDRLPDVAKKPQNCPYTAMTCANAVQVLAMGLRGMRRQRMTQLALYNTLLAISKGYVQSHTFMPEKPRWLSYGLTPQPYLMAITSGNQKDDDLMLLWGDQSNLSYRQYIFDLKVEGVSEFLEGMYYVPRGKQVLILPTLPSDVTLSYTLLEDYCWAWLKRTNKRAREKVRAFGVYLPQVFTEKEVIIKELHLLGYQIKGKRQEDGQYLSEVLAIKWLS